MHLKTRKASVISGGTKAGKRKRRNRSNVEPNTFAIECTEAAQAGGRSRSRRGASEVIDVSKAEIHISNSEIKSFGKARVRRVLKKRGRIMFIENINSAHSQLSHRLKWLLKDSML